MTKGGFELPSDYGRLAERVGFEPTVRCAPDSSFGKAASIRRLLHLSILVELYRLTRNPE